MKSFSKHRWFTSAAPLAILTLLALGHAAQAQDINSGATAAPKSEDTVVIVTGQRAQLKSAQKIKKESGVIVDSVTAVDIGALPDRSVAEALQRISGITIQRAAESRDPIRMTAEAGGVEIRGLAWVRSELNGRDVFSAKNGRGLSWGDVSSDLLAGVDVYKNASSDMVEGGVGGTVNLRTRLPFDSKKQVLAFTADTTYGDLQKKSYNSYSLLYSNRWHTSIGEIGALFNYSLVNEGNTTNVTSVDRYVATKTSSGSTVYLPNSIGYRTISWTQKRTSASMALQWRPNADWEFTLQAMDAKAEPKNTEYSVGFNNDNGEFSSTDSMASYSYDANGVFKSGTIKNAGITTDTRYGEDHNETADISLGFRWNASDKLTFGGDLQYVRSTAKVLSNTTYLQSANTYDVDVNLSGALPTISVADTGTASDPSAYYWYAAMDHVEKNDGKEIAARLDATYDFDSGWLKNIKVGIRATDKNYVTRQSGWNWGLLSHAYWGGGTAVYASETGADSYTIGSFSNFMNGAVSTPTSVVFPSASTVNQGTASTYAQLAGTESVNWAWSPVSTDWDSYAASGGLNTQKEKTYAAYAVAKFSSEPTLWGEARTLDGNFGVRVVKTESEGSSYIVVSAPSTSATCSSNCSIYTQYNTFASGGFTQAYGGSTNYTNVLPSLNVRLKYNDKLQFRFAVSKGIVRPELSWLTPYTTLSSSFTINADTGVLSAYTLTGTGGNPNLKPIEANNYDFTSEWYFAPTGSLTIDLFKKDLKNYIYTQASTETYTNNGVSLDFDVTRYVNGSATGKVSGYEIAYSQFFDFLPSGWSGLGVQGNYTHIDSSGGRNSVASVTDSNQVTGSNLNSLPLEGMSPESYNVALMYEKHGISARVAYNWRSSYLYTTSAANVNRPLWAGAYGQVDGSIFYTLNANYKIGMQVTNLGHSTTKQYVSSDLDKPLEKQFYAAIKTDKRVSFVLRGLF